MTATAHALVGGVIASSVQNPILGVTLSTISHPILDLVPHWDFGINWRHKSKIKLFIEAVADLGVGVILAYVLFGRNVHFWYFLACILGAEIWDILEAPYWFLKWRFPPLSWVYNIQSRMQGRARLPWGIITQIAAVLIIMFAFQSMSI